nr:MAG TPA: hypothetical protein [Caudoviricetes sp.]
MRKALRTAMPQLLIMPVKQSALRQKKTPI